MQTKSIVAAALLSTATLVASQNTIVSPAHSSKVIVDVSNYLSSVYQGAAFSSVVNELATGAPSSVLNAMISLGNDPSGPAYSSVISLLPADAQSFYVGIQSQASAIEASDLSVASTGTASPGGSTMSTASMTSATTSASAATTSGSTATSNSTTSTSGASAAASVTHNAATQRTAAVMVAGAAAAGILGLVALL